SMGQRGFGSRTDATPNDFSPTGDGNNAFQVPAVCIVFNAEDNYCQIRTLPQIQITPVNPLDGISQVLNNALTSLEQIRRQNCYSIKETNKNVLLYWLVNPDPNLTDIAQRLQGLSSNQSGQFASRVLAITQALSTGLGLVPQLLFLYQ